MNILILSWRDPLNPLAGGAEKVTLEYAKYWIKKGHSVYWVASKYELANDNELHEGIQVVRVGHKLGQTVGNLIFTYPMFLIAMVLKVFSFRSNFKADLIIDQIHGLPFFTPLYVQGRKVLWVCEVADEIWKKMFPVPISFAGRVLEKIVYSLYKNCEIWAISKSTKNDILKINNNLNVKVIPLGIYLPKIEKKVEKSTNPSAVFLARIVKMKGAEAAINACRKIIKRYPKFTLTMIGSGPPEYLTYLKNLCTKYELTKVVKFVGRVSEKEKYTYLQRAHFMIHPSYKEGFGLTVLEAGSCGTPTIARGGSSLEELITHDKDGLVFSDDEDIANLFLTYYSSPKYKKMSEASVSTANSFLWSKILPTSEKITKV